MADRTQQRITVRAAAAALGVSEAAILKRIKRKTLPAEKDQAGQWRVILPAGAVASDTYTPDTSPDRPDILPDKVPDTEQQAPSSLPADILARMAALETENTLQREMIDQARADGDQWRGEAARWQQQAETMGRLLDQQQRLSLADKAKEAPALVDGSDQAAQGKPRQRKKFLWW